MSKTQIHLLTGPERYALKESLDQLTKKYVDPDWADFNFEQLDASQVEASSIIDKWLMPPFGGEARVIAVDFVCKQGDRLFESFITLLNPFFDKQTPSTNNYLILIGEKIDKRKKENKKLLKYTSHQSFDTIKPWMVEKELHPWLDELVRQNGFRISRDALLLLVRSLGTDKFLLQKNLEKIYIYLGEKGTIQADHIRLLVAPSKADVFQLLECIAHRQLGSAQEQLQVLLLRDKPAAILGALASLLQKIYRMKSLLSLRWSQDAIAKNIGMHAFVVKKNIQLWDAYSVKELNRKLRRLIELDALSKQGKFSQTWVLEIWICECIS